MRSVAKRKITSEENELVTKGYLEERLFRFEDSITTKLSTKLTVELTAKLTATLTAKLEKVITDNVVTKLIKEERAMLHEALLESLENAKVYHQMESGRHMEALLEQWRSDSRAFHEYMQGIKTAVDNHDERIGRLEAVIA